MKLLPSLSRLFATPKRISTVSVYRRADCFFVVTQHGSGGSDPYLVAGPLDVLPVDSSPCELGEAVLKGLARTTYDYPRPVTPPEWKKVIAPLLYAAKCKSWSSFAKGSSHVRVDRDAGDVHVMPSERDGKGNFHHMAERDQRLTNSSAEQLGSTVAAELKFASARDDA